MKLLPGALFYHLIGGSQKFSNDRIFLQEEVGQALENGPHVPSGSYASGPPAGSSGPSVHASGLSYASGPTSGSSGPNAGSQGPSGSSGPLVHASGPPAGSQGPSGPSGPHAVLQPAPAVLPPGPAVSPSGPTVTQSYSQGPVGPSGASPSPGPANYALPPHPGSQQYGVYTDTDIGYHPNTDDTYEYPETPVLDGSYDPVNCQGIRLPFNCNLTPHGSGDCFLDSLGHVKLGPMQWCEPKCAPGFVLEGSIRCPGRGMKPENDAKCISSMNGLYGTIHTQLASNPPYLTGAVLNEVIDSVRHRFRELLQELNKKNYVLSAENFFARKVYINLMTPGKDIETKYVTSETDMLTEIHTIFGHIIEKSLNCQVRATELDSVISVNTRLDCRWMTLREDMNGSTFRQADIKLWWEQGGTVLWPTIERLDVTHPKRSPFVQIFGGKCFDRNTGESSECQTGSVCGGSTIPHDATKMGNQQFSERLFCENMETVHAQCRDFKTIERCSNQIYCSFKPREPQTKTRYNEMEKWLSDEHQWWPLSDAAYMPQYHVPQLHLLSTGGKELENAKAKQYVETGASNDADNDRDGSSGVCLPTAQTCAEAVLPCNWMLTVEEFCKIGVEGANCVPDTTNGFNDCMNSNESVGTCSKSSDVMSLHTRKNCGATLLNETDCAAAGCCWDPSFQKSKIGAGTPCCAGEVVNIVFNPMPLGYYQCHSRVEASCVCPDGKPKRGSECIDLGGGFGTQCSECNIGYHLTVDYQCIANSCMCDNGTPPRQEDCLLTRDMVTNVVMATHMCVDCNEGFHHEGKKCEPNSCRCPNGIPSDSDICALTPKFLCESCNEFYHMNTDRTLCEENICTCENGTADIMCDEHLKQKCLSCDIEKGYHLFENKCNRNQCRCPHGQPMQEVYCDVHNEIKCEYCFENEGYHLDGKECKKNMCECPHGVPASGRSCPSDGEWKCMEICNEADGYHLDWLKNQCVENECHCRNGTGTFLEHCTVHGSEVCGTCDPGYEMDANRLCVAVSQCTCENGFPLQDSVLCAMGGGNMCKSCKFGELNQATLSCPKPGAFCKTNEQCNVHVVEGVCPPRVCSDAGFCEEADFGSLTALTQVIQNRPATNSGPSTAGNLVVANAAIVNSKFIQDPQVSPVPPNPLNHV